MDSTSQMTVYKDILIKMETVELDESLKLAGVTSENLPNFKNITVFHEKFEPVMRSRENPFVEIGISSNISNRAAIIFSAARLPLSMICRMGWLGL